MPTLTEEDKKHMLITSSLGALDILRTVDMDEKVRRAIKRIEIALAANGYVHKNKTKG